MKYLKRKVLDNVDQSCTDNFIMIEDDQEVPEDFEGISEEMFSCCACPEKEVDWLNGD